jgi:hypothetical protein
MNTTKQLGILVAGLTIGTLGTFAYEHYLGEGSELAQAHADLASANANLAKIKEDDRQLKNQTDAESAQIQQLTSSKEDLTHQLDALKSASATDTTPSAPNPVAAGMMKAGEAQYNQQRLFLLKTRLHLTPEQEAAVKAAMEQENKLGEEMMAKFSSGKVDPRDPQTMTDLKAMTEDTKTVDQTLNDILTPDQKTAYQQMQTDQQNSAQESMALSETNQLAPLLQLTDSQKDQVDAALYQLNTQGANGIKSTSVNPSDPTAFLDGQAQAKEDALAKILTPDQLAVYHQQAQSQLQTQKAMMQKLMPTPPSTSAPPASQ